MSVRFHADPGGDGGGPPAPEPAPGPPPEAYPAPDPTLAPEPAAAEPTVPAGLTWDSPELYDLVDQRAQQVAAAQLEQLAPVLEQLMAERGQPTAAAAAPGLVPALDPLSETFGQDLQQLLAQERQQTIDAMQRMFGDFTQPMQQQMEAQQREAVTAKGEENLAGMLDDNISRYGDFPADPETGRSAKELVRPLADALFPRIAATLGETPRAAELAIEQAAQMVRDMGGVYARQGVNRETTRLSALAGARGEPGAFGNGGVPTAPEPRSPREVTERYAAEARRLHSEGHY